MRSLTRYARSLLAAAITAALLAIASVPLVLADSGPGPFPR